MMNNASRAIGTAVLMLAASAATANAPTGSGSVQFEFLSFTGPVQQISPPAFPGEPEFVRNSVVNGVKPPLTGAAPIPVGPSSATVWRIGSISFEAGTTGVDFGYEGIPASSPFANHISFAPSTFSNVAPGEDFTLGTFTYRNGGWFGGGATADFNVPTLLPFRIWTTSSDGPQFNQERFGILMHTVNVVPGDGGFDPANYAAEADWITVFMGDDPTDSTSWIEVADFRVYDFGLAPSGFTNTGSVDLVGAFGSLDLVGFANPVGGFIAGSNLPLAPGTGGVTPGVIPEPATWAMLIAGFGLVGGTLRRRRDMRAA